MAPYLPQTGAGGGGSPYSEGGALYALGLIHANHGEGIKQFLRDSLRSTNVEVHLLSTVQCSVQLCSINCYYSIHSGTFDWCRLFNMVHA